MRGPKQHKGRNSDQENATRIEKLQCISNCSNWLRNMLQHVQHQNERKLPVKPEAPVECADVNTRTMLPQVVNQASRWLNSLNISEFKKAIKEQAVTAAHVENSAPSPPGLVGSNDV